MNLLTLHDETQELVADVVAKVKAAVVATMGPNGKLAFIANGTAVKVTKDGVTVAKSIRFDDPRQELINRVITEAAIKTDHECGDGTTTTILLTSVLYDLLIRHTSFREQKYIEECVLGIIDELKTMSIMVKVDDSRLYKLALTSSNNDEELSKIVTDIYKESGDRYPEIELKEGQTATDKVVRTKGLPINMHFSNPGFSKNGNGSDTDFEDFIPLIVDTTVGRGVDLTDTLISLDKRYTGKVVVIVARSVEHETCQMLARLNNNTRLRKEQAGDDTALFAQAGAHFIAINTNAGGSVGTLLMQDIAAMFDAPIFTTLEDTLAVQIRPVASTLTVNGTRSVLSNIPDDIRALLTKRADAITTELSGYEMGDRFSVRAKFNETRIRNLRGELVTVFVGGETYSDVKERIDRFEDVVKAVKSALVNGILPGVGSALVTATRVALKKMILALPEGKVFTSSEHAEDRLSGFIKSLLTPSSETLERDIILGLAAIAYAPYNHLMSQADEEFTPSQIHWFGDDAVPLCTNLATGEFGTSEELGVYDTAYATITALRGGLQTAKILANASSILLGDKLFAVASR